MRTTHVDNAVVNVAQGDTCPATAGCEVEKQKVGRERPFKMEQGTYHSPVYEYAAPSIDAFLNKPVACREVLQQILVVYIIHFDDLVRKTLEERLVQWQAQDGQYMRNARCLQRLSAA